MNCEDEESFKFSDEECDTSRKRQNTSYCSDRSGKKSLRLMFLTFSNDSILGGETPENSSSAASSVQHNGDIREPMKKRRKYSEANLQRALDVHFWWND